jgi:hypothetical protein
LDAWKGSILAVTLFMVDHDLAFLWGAQNLIPLLSSFLSMAFYLRSDGIS